MRLFQALTIVYFAFITADGNMASANEQPPLNSELIVLLTPSPPGPNPEAVVHAINNNKPVPGGLGEGHPNYGELLAERATGRLLQRVIERPDSPEARMQRYILLRFPSHVNLEAIKTALSNNPSVQSVEENLRFRYHVSGMTAKSTIPSDSLVGTGSSFPDDAQ